MQRWRRALMLGVVAGVAAAAPPAAAQVCNGLPFRGRGIVAASYLSGDAADSPFALREYGASVTRQLPGWSPLATHHVVQLEGGAGRASFDTLTAGAGPTHFAGSGGSLGGSYTLDVLPGSYIGDYVLCISGGLQGQWWRVSGLNGGGLTVPLWLSFGAPLRLGPTGVFPHAAFGGYWRAVTGEAPYRSVRAHGLRPWSEAGVGVLLGPTRLDGAVRHEFRTRERLVLTLGLEL